MTLNRTDLPGQPSQKGRLKATPSSDLKYTLVSLKVQGLEIERMGGRFRYRLAMPDKEGLVKVGSSPEVIWNEQVPRDGVKGVQHRQIVDAAGPQLFDQTSAALAESI